MASVFSFFPNLYYPKRRFFDFTQYITHEEVCSDPVEITEFPVENGSDISDHRIIKPPNVLITLSFDGTQPQLAQIYQEIIDLKYSVEPFEVITGKRSYSDMLIEDIQEVNDIRSENRLSLKIIFKHVNIVAVMTTTLPPPTRQSKASQTESTQITGQKTPNVQTERKRTALAAGAGL